jgi:hypothetical protein
LLRQAVAKGLNNAGNVAQDTDLDLLHVRDNS